jgi:hypothetical protein
MFDCSVFEKIKREKENKQLLLRYLFCIKSGENIYQSYSMIIPTKLSLDYNDSIIGVGRHERINFFEVYNHRSFVLHV